jgi:hypothetical protein
MFRQKALAVASHDPHSVTCIAKLWLRATRNEGSLQIGRGVVPNRVDVQIGKGWRIMRKVHTLVLMIRGAALYLPS